MEWSGTIIGAERIGGGSRENWRGGFHGCHGGTREIIEDTKNGFQAVIAEESG